MHSHAAHTSDQHRGQTLAEFALSLPILLLLLFGIIEFGRLFQAWVTIQNSARTAARYAVTGGYNEERYDIDAIVPCVFTPPGSPLQEVPLTWQEVSFSRAEGFDDVTVELYEPTSPPGAGQVSEHLYTSWYGIRAADNAAQANLPDVDCYPDDLSFQRRKDMLRLVSIYDEARRGASGLSLEPPRVEPTADSVEDFLYSAFQRPQSGWDQRGWFNMLICSTRNKIYGNELSSVVDNPDDSSLQPELRFYTAIDDPAYPVDSCVLKEKPNVRYGDPISNGGGIPDNHDVQWMDAGSPGDRITVIVTFNHPLITPLGFNPYIRLQARRTAVNESFRVTNAENIAPNSIPPAVVPPTAIAATSTFTLAPATPTSEPTTSVPPTATEANTATPEPFTCDRLSASTLTFYGNRVFIQFRNDNVQPTELTRTWLNWNEAAVQGDYPNTYMALQALDGEVFWMGADYQPETSTVSEGTFYTSADRALPGLDGAQWSGTFLNGPALLADYWADYDFSGSIFYFYNPATGGECEIALDVPPGPPPPTATPPDFVPSPTFTPDCASDLMDVEFVSFDPLGDVRLRVVNNRYVVAPFMAFDIRWPDLPGLSLVKVVVGGANANDLASSGGDGVIIWQNTTGGDPDPRTDSGLASDGNWLTSYTFPPNSITAVHLDFTGVGASTLQSLGVHPSDFNGSRFRIGCGAATQPSDDGGAGDGGSSGWSGDEGDIFLNEVATALPTRLPVPTRTPGPTFTPSITPTPRPPRPTNTPGPVPTATRVPPTPVPTQPAQPTATFTPPQFGGAD